MTGLLVVMIAGMFGLTKWIESMNDYDEPDWKVVVQGELTECQRTARESDVVEGRKGTS